MRHCALVSVASDVLTEGAVAPISLLIFLVQVVTVVVCMRSFCFDSVSVTCCVF